jgi:hypothetical protein
MFEQDKSMNLVKKLRLIAKRVGPRSAGVQGARSSIDERFSRFISDG